MDSREILEQIRSFVRIRGFPLYFLRRRSLLTVPQHGRCARGRIALLLFWPTIVKYKRLEPFADSSSVHLGFVLETNISLSLVDGRNICMLNIAGCVDTFYFNDVCWRLSEAYVGLMVALTLITKRSYLTFVWKDIEILRKILRMLSKISDSLIFKIFDKS